MKANDLILKCYAKKDGGVWVAHCLDLSLATQGDSFDEVKRKLEEQIVFYVDEALADKEYGSQLLNRKAPLSSWVEYYLIKFTHDVCHNIGQIFNETMPLRLA